MAATTGASGIIYTSSSSAVFTESLCLELYAGSPTDDGDWLAAGATAASKADVYYPGTLGGFEARQTDRTNTKGYKLVCGRFTTGLANDETITLSGNASKIIAVIVGDNSTAAAGVTLKEAISDAGVATFKVTSTSDALVTCWMIVA